MIRKSTSWSCAIVLLIPLTLTGGDRRTIPSGASIFIEEMAEDLDGYIRAEIVSKRLPLNVTIKRNEAHIVMTGSSTGTEKRDWHEGWLTTTRDHATGNVMIFDRASKSMLWAAEAGDRSLWWGSMARGGQRKVASRLVDKLKDSIAQKQLPLPPPPPLSAEELSAASSSSTVSVQQADPVLHNDDVIKMVKAGISDEVIISRIKSGECEFDLGTDAIIALKNAGVSDAVLAAMMQPAKKTLQPVGAGS